MPSNHLVCQAGVYFSAPLVWTMSTLNFLHRLCCLTTVRSLHFPSLVPEFVGLLDNECCQKKRNGPRLLSFFLSFVHSRKKAISCTLESLRLVFNSDFCAFSSDIFSSSLFCANLRPDEVKGDSFHPSFLLFIWQTEKREVNIHSFTLSPVSVCVCLFYVFSSIPNVTAMKMMTATPSTIARQLSSIDRRPYFLAPSISPVWRTDFD